MSFPSHTLQSIQGISRQAVIITPASTALPSCLRGCFCRVCKTGVMRPCRLAMVMKTSMEALSFCRELQLKLHVEISRDDISLGSCTWEGTKLASFFLFLFFFLSFFLFFPPLFHPKETHGKLQKYRKLPAARATAKQPTEGHPDLQLLHKIKSMQPSLGKHPRRLFITK